MAEAKTRRREEQRPVEQFPGVTRRTLVSGERLTLVEIRIAEGSEVPEHEHPHEQAGRVASGRVRIRLGGEEHEFGPGDAYLIPGALPHRAFAVEPVVLIEAFSPVREDFADD